jgi:hypothetical protein
MDAFRKFRGWDILDINEIISFIDMLPATRGDSANLKLTARNEQTKNYL